MTITKNGILRTIEENGETLTEGGAVGEAVVGEAARQALEVEGQEVGGGGSKKPFYPKKVTTKGVSIIAKA